MIRFTGITFDPNFKEKSKANFERTQKYIDSETLRYSDPYVPFRTGMMKKSGISGTVIGSGVIEYTAPYAKKQYYTNAGRGKEGLNAVKGTKGLRGAFFFERMKADHKDDILKGVKKQ
ncbi:MAG: capsid protein [Ruminococcus sp.]|nr:capsid protein [Ruminococcus sp.]